MTAYQRVLFILPLTIAWIAKPTYGLDQWKNMKLGFAITDLKLPVLSLVQTTIGFGKPTGSTLYHMSELYPSR